MNQSINKTLGELSLFSYVAIFIFGLQFLGGFLMYIGDVAFFSGLKDVLFPFGAVLLMLGCFRTMAILPSTSNPSVDEVEGCSADGLKMLIAREPKVTKKDKWMYVLFSIASRRLILERALKSKLTNVNIKDEHESIR